jgi:predicted RNase H-like HicB family nuclease
MLINADRSVQYPGVIIMKRQLTAIIEREGDGYVSLCPELDIASQGETIEDARNNLREALELFFETASQEEIQARLHEEVYVTRVEVAVG